MTVVINAEQSRQQLATESRHAGPGPAIKLEFIRTPQSMDGSSPAGKRSEVKASYKPRVSLRWPPVA